MDKAYSDHKLLEKLTRLGIWYVTRLKDNVKYKVLKALEDFKRIKQNFPLKYFYGDSVNAVKSNSYSKPPPKPRLFPLAKKTKMAILLKNRHSRGEADWAKILSIFTRVLLCLQ
jgi:hypothetical protein